jgi:hypothetical protein
VHASCVYVYVRACVRVNTMCQAACLIWLG